MTFLADFDAVQAKSAPPAPPKGFAEDFDATPAKKETPKAAPAPAPARAALGEPDAADQIIRSMVQNTGAGIIAGWRGMATLATAGGDFQSRMKLAADAANEELEGRSYTPESDKAAAVMQSPWNPLNWFGAAAKAAGEVAQDRAGAGPGTATAVETAINAAPLLLMRRGNVDLAKAARVTEGAPAGAATGAPGVAEAALSLEDQTARAATLKRVGIDEVRKSAVTGDAKAAATDYQQSKLDNQPGRLMKSKLDAERSALEKHAEAIVRDTGGSQGMDSSAMYARGGTILEPLDKLSDFFDRSVKALYKQADERAAGVKLETPRLREVVGGDQAEFLGTTEGEALLKGVKARMKSLKMAEGEGVTVAEAERLKQYLNNVWQPRTSKLIRSLRDAIDDDVMSSAGEDLYNQARAMRRMRAVTLDEPNGIGKLMDASGPEGINRAVPVEKVPDVVAGMPIDQLAHVVRTLNALPEELRPLGQAAMAEIKAHFAGRILDAGSSPRGAWGAAKVSQYVRNNKARLEMVFSPEELARLGDLEEAGRILRFDQSYPGAAVQEHNLVVRGAMAATRAAGAATGGAIGAAVGAPGLGAAVGDVAASKLAGKWSEAAALRQTQKRFVKLSDFP